MTKTKKPLVKFNRKLTLMAIIPLLTSAKEQVNTRIISHADVKAAGGKFFSLR